VNLWTLLRAQTFWAAVTALVLLRFALTADLSVPVEFSRYDENLYVSRALHLLMGAGMGPFDSLVLAKLPGMSLWLAGLRALGLPYFLVLNLVFVASGLYAMQGLRRLGLPALAGLIVFALHLLDPMAMGHEWTRPMREPLSSVLLMTLAGAMAHILAGIAGDRLHWRHVAILGVGLAFSMLLREEDRLLWGLLVLFAIALWQHARPPRPLLSMAVVVLIPVLVVTASNFGMRRAVERWYALPVLHAMGEGEFPGLIAAIRSVDTGVDNRLVSVPQATLAVLRHELPRFAPVVDRLPPPAASTWSCRLQGVCSEWSNGWMLFWIRDAVGQAGFAPDLPSEQAYYREIRTGIEAACTAGRLRCRPQGSGVIRPFELRWTRAYADALGGLVTMALFPHVTLVTEPPARFNVPVELGRRYQAILMVDYFDSLRETAYADTGGRLVSSPLAAWRAALHGVYRIAGGIVIALSWIALAYCWLVAAPAQVSGVLRLATIFHLYAFVRLMALAYVSTFLGPFDSRMVMSTYLISLFMAVPLLVEAWRVRRGRGVAARARAAVAATADTLRGASQS
jgi:hypothetical protein